MADMIARIEALLTRAAHEGTPEEEARSCAVIAAREIKKKDLRSGPVPKRTVGAKPCERNCAGRQISSGILKSSCKRRNGARMRRSAGQEPKSTMGRSVRIQGPDTGRNPIRIPSAR